MPAVIDLPKTSAEAPLTPMFFRPLYIKRVPESVWILVHDNAIRSRMRLQDYLIRILAQAESFAPETEAATRIADVGAMAQCVPVDG